MKLWAVVARGEVEYPDDNTAFLGVFSTKKKAEDFAKKWKDPDAEEEDEGMFVDDIFAVTVDKPL